LSLRLQLSSSPAWSKVIKLNHQTEDDHADQPYPLLPASSILFLTPSTATPQFFTTLRTLLPQILPANINGRYGGDVKQLSNIHDLVSYFTADGGGDGSNGVGDILYVSQDLILRIIEQAQLEQDCKLQNLSNYASLKHLELTRDQLLSMLRLHPLSILVNNGNVTEQDYGKKMDMLRNVSKFEVLHNYENAHDVSNNSCSRVHRHLLHRRQQPEQEQQCDSVLMDKGSDGGGDKDNSLMVIIFLNLIKKFQYFTSPMSMQFWRDEAQRKLEVNLLAGLNTFFYSSTCKNVQELLPHFKALEVLDLIYIYILITIFFCNNCFARFIRRCNVSLSLSLINNWN
jgi:hypothetical protein